MLRNTTLSVVLLISLLSSSSLCGVIVTVSNADIEGVGGLRSAMNQVNASVDLSNTINITPSALMNQVYNLPPINISGKSLVVNGAVGGTILNGQNLYRGFLVSAGDVTLNNMEFTNTRALGGNGGMGNTPGGGGMGAGGAFFVRSGSTLTLNSIVMTSSSAHGGSGGGATGVNSGGGGGGMGGKGGDGTFTGIAIPTGGGGGGLFGNGSVGDPDGAGVGGGGLLGNGGFSGGIPFLDLSGGGGGGGDGVGVIPPAWNGQNGAGGVGGNGGNSTGMNGRGGLNSGNPSENGENGNLDNIGGGGGAGGNPGGNGGDGAYGGGGGGGGWTLLTSAGGNGGDFGGGGSGVSSSGTGGFGGGGAGGSSQASGGAGNFGGGGGGADIAPTNGGFGGGGSGSGLAAFGQGGAFAGNGGNYGSNGKGGGGGGAGLGGAIFIHLGGTVLIHDGSSFTAGTNDVVAGLGGSPYSSGTAGDPGQAFGKDIFMMASAQLTVDITNDLNIPSDIIGDQGAGGGSVFTNGLTKLGTGTLTLGGNNTYSGTTLVTAGTLALNGSVTTPADVQNGALLTGMGTVYNVLTVETGGALSPTPFSVFHANSLVLNPSSQLIINADSAGNSSLLDIAGNALLDGILTMDFAAGQYPIGELFTILNAPGGVSGQFSSTQTTQGVSYSVIYLPNSVQVVIGNVIPPSPPSPSKCPVNFTLSLAGVHDNARKVGNYLNRNYDQPVIQSIIQTLRQLSSEDLSDALKSISPGRNAMATYVAQDVMFSVNQVAATRMSIQRSSRWLGQHNSMVASAWQETLEANNEALPQGSTTKAAAGTDEAVFWVAGIGDFSHQKAQRQNPAFSFNAEGGMLGFETYKLSNLLVGAAAGYAQSHITMDSEAGSNLTNYYFAGIYLTSYLGQGYFEFGLWGTYDHFKNKRHIAYPGFSATAHSTHTGWQLTPLISGGYDVDCRWGIFEPFLSAQAVINVEQGFTETNAFPYNMRQDPKTSELLRLEGGFNGYETWTRDWGSVILRETLSYVRRQFYGVGTVNAAIVGAPGTLTVYSLTQDQNILSAGAELFIKNKSGGFVSASYVGEYGFGSGYFSNEVIGKIGVYF